MPERPNVLFVMTDQQRGDCLGADPACPTDEHGDPVVHTPTLNHLAERGTLFSRAYTPNPVCVPARRCLWTGQTAATNGCTKGNSPEPWAFDHTLPGELRDAGYQTGLVGKTHSQPLMRGSNRYTRFGFEEMETCVGQSIWEDDYGRWLRGRGGDDRRGTGLSHQPEDARPWHRAEFEHPTNWTARQALDFLDRHDETRPFFLALSFYHPHAPLHPPRVYWEQYIDRDLPEPAVGDWVEELYGSPEDTPWLRDGPVKQDQRVRAGYYGLITQIDHQLNRVLYALDWAHDELDDTVVVFTSDHGEMLGDHHHWAKRAPYDASARVPLLLDVPDGYGVTQPGGQVVDRPVGLEDLMPTLLGLTGVSVPETVEGHDVCSLIEDPTEDSREFYHGETGTRPASHYLAGGEVKYVWFSETGDELLFDVSEDPEEMRDLSTDPAYRDALETCRGELASQLAGREEGFVGDGVLTPLATE